MWQRCEATWVPASRVVSRPKTSVETRDIRLPEKIQVAFKGGSVRIIPFPKYAGKKEGSTWGRAFFRYREACLLHYSVEIHVVENLVSNETVGNELLRGEPEIDLNLCILRCI